MGLASAASAVDAVSSSRLVQFLILQMEGKTQLVFELKDAPLTEL